MHLLSLAFIFLLILNQFLLSNSYVTTYLEPAVLLPVTAYWRYFLSGALSVSLSHVVTVPFDVVKTKTQTNPQFAGKNPIEVSKQVLAEEGPGAFLQGLGPTSTGYFIQGSLKYGLYEYFKPIIRNILFAEGIALDKIYFFMLASFFAECFGSTVLSPFEAARIRLVSQPDFSKGLVGCLTRMKQEEGTISLFLGLPAMLLKNIPYSVVQLTIFEAFTSAIYSKLTELGFSNEEAFAYHIPITACSALAAAIAGVIASQPGDSLLSAINKGKDPKDLLKAKSSLSTKTPSTPLTPAEKKRQELMVKSPQEMTMGDSVALLGQLSQEIGIKGMFKGIQARMIHVSTILVVQLLAYDFIKELCGLPPTGYH